MEEYDEHFIQEALQGVVSHIYRVADKVVDYHEGESRKKLLDGCRAAMTKCCELEVEHTLKREIVDKTIELLNAEGNERTTKEIYIDLKSKMVAPDRDATKTLMYKNLEQVILKAEKRAAGQSSSGGSPEQAETEVSAPAPEDNEEQVEVAEEEEELAEGTEESDEDVAMTQMTVSLIDPFTRTEMTDPVMSKKCQHSFERNSIMSLLKDKSRIRCPTPGCGYITARDIVPNMELKRYLEERHAKREVKRKRKLNRQKK